MTFEEVKDLLGSDSQRFAPEPKTPQEKELAQKGQWSPWPRGIKGDEIFEWGFPRGYVNIWVGFKNGRVCNKKYHHFE